MRGCYMEDIAFSNYPECRNTKEFTRSEDGAIEIRKAEDTGEICEKCGSPMVIKRGRFFYGCTDYPNCKFATWDKPVAETCPNCGSKILVEKYSKKTGKTTLTCPNKECKYKKSAG
jgi:DNA topoisomerase-1